jgi:hypothetical protein
VPVFIADVRAEIPNAVVATRRLAEDERTRDRALAHAGGLWRRIRIVVEVEDRGAANAEAIRLLREVLGDAVTGELWVEQIGDVVGEGG